MDEVERDNKRIDDDKLNRDDVYALYFERMLHFRAAAIANGHISYVPVGLTREETCSTRHK